ncbi:glutamate receptor ionotropic, delta-2-like [Daphnia pulicaria]|uniref:glutamate receptor ionotropic, delta-2-like n=1 Tax=Daphnia pulicaria TaxID=35523 RepID=UPI001EEAFF46|nr:glutamate receptor ionotropic, delta-2-like [Daphnia pulicaria]
MQARKVAWYLFGTIVSQGLRFPSSYVSQRLLAAAWCLIAFVFVNVYCSTLTSYMSVTYQRPTINSVRDLAFTPSYKATVIAGSIQDIDLQRSRNEILKIIAERVEKCSADCKKFNLIDLATTVLEKDNYVSILPYTVGILLLKNYNSERTQCRLALAYEKMSWKPMFYGVPKSSPYIEEINQGSLRFIDSGLRDYWYRNEEKLPAQCQLNYNSKGVASKRSSSRIKLEQFYLPFLILFAGYLLALAQFCREQIGRCLSTKKI